MIGDAMESSTWFPCYPSDLIGDTTHLCNHDFGAYWRLLCWYYCKGPPPDDDETLRQIMRVEKTEWQRTRGNVMAFFQLNGDGRWHQKRADEVIAERDTLIAKKRAQTAAARAANPKNTVTDTVTRSVTEDVTAVQPKPKPKVQLNPQPQPSILNKGLEEKSVGPQTKSFRALTLANRIVANANGWWWDNCKVPINGIKANSLARVIEPHVGKANVLNAWASASKDAHSAVVDGLDKAVRDPVGYCIACFKTRLTV